MGKPTDWNTHRHLLTVSWWRQPADTAVHVTVFWIVVPVWVVSSHRGWAELFVLYCPTTFCSVWWSPGQEQGGKELVTINLLNFQSQANIKNLLLYLAAELEIRNYCRWRLRIWKPWLHSALSRDGDRMADWWRGRARQRSSWKFSSIQTCSVVPADK